jgi:hypothetical protein
MFKHEKLFLLSLSMQRSTRTEIANIAQVFFLQNCYIKIYQNFLKLHSVVTLIMYKPLNKHNYGELITVFLWIILPFCANFVFFTTF